MSTTQTRVFRLPGRVWTLARRPAEMVEATRWLFAVLTVVSVLLALPAPLAAADGPMLVVALASAVVLGLSWGSGYVRRSAPLGMDVVDALATLAFALVCPSPAAALGFVFSGLWFRSLYGSARRAVLRCTLYAVALSAALPLWPYIPGHAGGTAIGPLVGVYPTMLLTVIVGRHLAGGLRAREESARRDAVQMAVGSQLLGVTNADEIRRIAWTAIAGICATSAGLRVLKVVRDGAALRVDQATSGFARVPATLPAAVLSVLGSDGESGRESDGSRAELDAAAGTPCAWAGIPLPVTDRPEVAWLLLGSPRRVPAEAVAAIGSLVNQVSLALSYSETHQELTVQATLDGLTGLANRTSFNAALSAALDDQSAPDTTVLFVDLDDFKDVNDAFGHIAGDDLLREVAARLSRATRPADLCARLGGDEFAVLLRDTSTAIAGEVAQRMVRAVSAPVHLGGRVANVGVSVGVATATGETDLEQLIHRADVAMYAAKANGKARVQVFEPGLLPGGSAQVSFEGQLAVAARHGELIVHYQPVLSLPGVRCTAVEALVRWQHPERGLLYPDAFIELAERTGAIRDIGAHVLRRACADTATWRNAHPSLKLAVHVNVSALQLDDDRFIANVIRCLRDFNLPADRLVLEITETVVIASPAAIDRLHALAAHGVTIAIDDFGTGYSALTTLRSLPVRIVKIDKSFVAGSTANPEDRAVTEAVVRMVAQLGLQTIAEGVERLDQQEFLTAIGAGAAQGSLYLRPTTVKMFSGWLDAHLAGPPHTEPTGEVIIPFPPRQTA